MGRRGGRRWLSMGIVLVAGCQAVGGSGREAGILIGLSPDRALWIVERDGEFRVAAELPHVLVPRGDELWWVGTVSRCTVDSLTNEWVDESEFVNREERSFAVRAGDTARVELDGTDCRDAELRVKRRQIMLDSSLTDAERTAYLAGIVADNEPIPDAYCSLDTRSISFVSPELISIEARQSSTEFCNPGRYATWGSNAVRRLERDERVSLRGLLQPEQWEPIRARFAVSDSSNPCIYDEDRTDAALDSAWAIARSQGSWTATFWMDGPVVCRGGMDEAVLDVLPDSLTGTPPLAVAWEDIVAQEPRAIDAVSSPSGRWLVIHADSLVIVPVVRGKLGARVLSVPATYEERFNMVRWVSRAEADRLSGAIRSLSPPVVVIQAPRQ